VRGIAEVGEFAGGAVVHLAEGFFGAALLVAWWRYRRYGRPDPGEHRT
jgi:ammonia channel protein AmtB